MATVGNVLETILIAQHLEKQMIAPIFRDSDEKNNLIALKLMCVVDYHVSHNNLYNRIKMQTEYPKLLKELLSFRSFGSFAYYNYQMNKSKFGKMVFKCKWCELVGNVEFIFTHMAINHNAHISVNGCVYCDRREHANETEFLKCYTEYLQKHSVTFDENVTKVVADFYEMLKKLSADTLNVCIKRNHCYLAKGRGNVESLQHEYGGLDNQCVVYRHKSTKSKLKNVSVKENELDTEYKRVISMLYGGDGASGLERALAKEEDNLPIANLDDQSQQPSANISINRVNELKENMYIDEQSTSKVITPNTEPTDALMVIVPKGNVEDVKLDEKNETANQPIVVETSFLNYLGEEMARLSHEKRQKLKRTFLKSFLELDAD